MADSNWKKRLGITINYSSGDEEDDQRVEYRNKSPKGAPITSATATASCTEKRHLDDGGGSLTTVDASIEEILKEFSEYGSTPPRTRLKNKSRDWDRRQKMMSIESGSGGNVAAKIRNSSNRLSRSRLNRRNTMDCAILNQMFIDEERNAKKSMQLLRESERDLKMSMAAQTQLPSTANRHFSMEVHLESMPAATHLKSGPISPKLIESCNRYMSVISRPVGCRMSAPPAAFTLKDIQIDRSDCSPTLKTRQSFHETFSNLIKLGSVDRQDNKLSNDDYKWQTELKDLIWLELQAWHADRTPEQQDKYLYAARQGIGDLLDEIMSYRFHAGIAASDYDCEPDSGIMTDSANSTHPTNSEIMFNKNTEPPCFGCLSMYCKDCLEQQSKAFRQVETLLARLETAERLFQSSQSMGLYFPLYKSKEFEGRVKAMCLWFNITRHHRLKLLILGKLLARLEGRHFQWPLNITPSDTSSSSAPENEDVLNETPPLVPRVQFTDVNDVNFNIDSSSSENSTKEMTNCDQEADALNCLIGKIDLFDAKPLDSFNNKSRTPYRKYIENVLKSRGLGKSLSFLHRIHHVVLRKAHITLEKPGTEEAELENDPHEDIIATIEMPIEQEQIDELRRYGTWSSEAKSLNLPSYVPVFIFLSLIPLEVIHEFLRMRLETRPSQPNPLSLEQLMKELREGLALAMTHRVRFNKHITTALMDREADGDKFVRLLEDFDDTVKKIFELYLDYVEQWILIAIPERQQKPALDKEWMFTKLICPMIVDQHSIAAKKFCNIVSLLLQNIGSRLVTRATHLDSQINETNTVSQDEEKKWQILTICREMQSLFTVERENCVKIMVFAKTLCRDIEHANFHRDHADEYLDENFLHEDVVCKAVKDAIRSLKSDALSVRTILSSVIERVQDRCHLKHTIGMEEQDQQAVLSRSREILHQGYKFGFEYHKDLVRLLESKVTVCRDGNSEVILSLGIFQFAKMWMHFVTDRCERGRGLRPRWAAQGFDFLIQAVDPVNTQHLCDTDFDELKLAMDKCIAHVIGISEPNRVKRRTARSRRASPCTRPAGAPSPTSISNAPKSLHPQFSLTEISQPKTVDTSDFVHHQSSCDNTPVTSIRATHFAATVSPLRQIRIRDAVNQLDKHTDAKLRDRKLIGQVKALNSCDKFHIRARSVTFRWHRGTKIGQGGFGKVYTAVNNSTGELMAMKEIPIQPGENRAIKRVAEELKIFEGISHKNLVKYYGVEIHREELLIFMELCAEGTLESLVELSAGLHEGLTRRFTAQIVSAVHELHQHGVIHRDIKTANIFLTGGGNCLKLGDFGSAAKIRGHQTMPGEMQGYVGTQAYMAPEVFTKTNSEGHGRAADIWSVGCVVIEMMTGKRPWSQFDSNFQIMFKVGMGEIPEAPDTLSDEGHDFLRKCLKHDPRDRDTATELLQHNFCKVDIDDCLCAMPEMRRSFRKESK